MWCIICKKQLTFCTCPDIEERLRKLRESDKVEMAWCARCNNHVDRCTCGAKN